MFLNTDIGSRYISTNRGHGECESAPNVRQSRVVASLKKLTKKQEHDPAKPRSEKPLFCHGSRAAGLSAGDDEDITDM
jgi:hypothetical protein